MKDKKVIELVSKLEEFRKKLENNPKASRDFLHKAGIVTSKGTLQANYKHLCIPRELV